LKRASTRSAPEELAVMSAEYELRLVVYCGPSPSGDTSGEVMPLDDREQRILEEIEAQFYEQDPEFAQSVRDTTLQSVTGRKIRLAIVGLVAGLILMVLSVGWIVTVIRRRNAGASSRADVGGMLDGLRRRWRRSS
jgi:hypothetical protein